MVMIDPSQPPDGAKKYLIMPCEGTIGATTGITAAIPSLRRNSRLEESNSISPILPPTSPAIVRKLREIQRLEIAKEQVLIFTEHLLHAGMYSRTITLPANTRLVGAFIKIPTVVIVVGSARVLVGREWATIEGYAVLPASADRKQIFESIGPLIITMIFPTDAQTVEEAEREFTDEHELLLSRRQGLNEEVITGEKA